MVTLINPAATFAIERHKDQLYGQKPYHIHLMDAVMVYRRFFDWSTASQAVIDAIWCHDVIEDTAHSEAERIQLETVLARAP
jgi:predicted metal-dependent HD superfamily phosphohydrolase